MISNEFVDTGENVHTYQQAKLAKKMTEIFNFLSKINPKKLSNFLIKNTFLICF